MKRKKNASILKEELEEELGNVNQSLSNFT